MKYYYSALGSRREWTLCRLLVSSSLFCGYSHRMYKIQTQTKPTILDTSRILYELRKMKG